MFDMIILVMMQFDITSGVSFNEKSFVPTRNMYKFGLKSLLLSLV